MAKGTSDKVNSRTTFAQSRPLVTLLAKWRRATTLLTEQLLREPTEAEVGAFLGLSEKKLRIALQAVQVASVTVHGDGEREGDPGSESSLYDTAVDERETSPAVHMAEAEVQEIILDRVDDLEAREAEVVRMRFGLGGRKQHTLREIGDKLSLSRERVRQLERKALTALAV